MHRTYLSQSVFVAAAGLPVIPGALRQRLLRCAGVQVSAPSLIHRGVVVQGLGRLRLGANSLVTTDCAPNALYVGSPARHRRDLP
ncbi:hypothetical protein [Rhodococcus artemisiae]|uniref:Uncharacterized protein n=1 Tax=Rhodococcus artemisiae TaxID=714159 RepID=A0ABU7LJZ0_9NOCA|nr:hypothetical protein [Rhodococcus artemisiae]MEE2061884.1 hypothetical protein [Rhodococcus artemisiae]